MQKLDTISGGGGVFDRETHAPLHGSSQTVLEAFKQGKLTKRACYVLLNDWLSSFFLRLFILITD